MANPTPEVISLIVEDQTFQVNKDILCAHSDYFRAMFSGNFSEEGKNEIQLDVVDANSMAIIISYMTIGTTDLAEMPLPTIAELALSANFLQVIELIKIIEHSLEMRLTMSNWLEIKAIAENASYKKLEQRSAALGLYDFKLMRPEFIPSIHKLLWYLSHTHLNADAELDVFKFGLKWVVENDNSADALLLVLGCLAMERLRVQDLYEIKILIKDYPNTLLEEVIELLYSHSIKNKLSFISLYKLIDDKVELSNKFTARVHMRALNIVAQATKRLLTFKPCAAVWPRDQECDKLNVSRPHFLYKFQNNKDMDPWLEVTERNLWGWKFVPWGARKIVIVCGEHGKGTGNFWRSVKVYDTLRKEWTEHGVQLPCRRHGAVTIKEDSLYIIGGVGAYRVVLDSAVVYDLKEKTHRKIANFPNAIQSPSACVHEGHVYASGHKNIYRYDDEDKENDKWVIAVKTDIRVSWMVSYKGYIYCVQSYFDELYRVKPNMDQKLEFVLNFSFAPSTMCIFWDKLLAFESKDITQSATTTLEAYSQGEKPIPIWRQEDSPIIINDVAGSCAILDDLPPLSEIPQYLDKCLADYEEAKRLAARPAVPGPSTSAVPGPSTSAVPGPSTSAVPGPSTSAVPGPSTSAVPGPSTSAVPGPSTSGV